MVGLMSRHEKLLQKLFEKPTPKDYKWSDLCTLLQGLGFEVLSGKGARRKFFNKELDCLIILHEPHPRPIVKACYVADIAKKLKDLGIKP